MVAVKCFFSFCTLSIAKIKSEVESSYVCKGEGGIDFMTNCAETKQQILRTGDVITSCKGMIMFSYLFAFYFSDAKSLLSSIQCFSFEAVAKNSTL